MFYVAMFDEVDEGTAIFKTHPDPPVGESPFLHYNGLPSDHYMWLAGKAQEALQKMLNAEKVPPGRPGVTIIE
jgi:glycoprotein endo-alpha-1,2-mannosidase